MTNERIQCEIGEFLHATRMEKNLPQQVLAERSGISVSAVKHLESGTGATLATFIAVCRTLGKLNWIEDLAPRGEISPVAVMDAKASSRQTIRRRARGKATTRGGRPCTDA